METQQQHTNSAASYLAHPELLTPEQVAKELTLSTKTLATWRSTGRHSLPFLRCGGRIRYRRCDVNAWLVKRTSASTQVVQGAE